MVGNDAHQPINLAENGFAFGALVAGLELAIGEVHFHAQPVHAADELLGGFDAMFEFLLPDEADGLHQGAGGIAQQDPIDGVMDVGG